MSSPGPFQPEILLIPAGIFPSLLAKECMYVQGKEETFLEFQWLEANLARESCRGENKPMKATRQELSADILQEAYGCRVVIQDIALTGESPASQLPGQCEGHQLAITFPAMLWQGIAMAHGGKLVCERPRDRVSLVITDTYTGEARDEFHDVPETLFIAAP